MVGEVEIAKDELKRSSIGKVYGSSEEKTWFEESVTQRVIRYTQSHWHMQRCK